MTIEVQKKNTKTTMSAGKQKRLSGVKEQFDKRGWAGFKKAVAEYCRRKEAAQANRQSTLTVTRIKKEAK